MSDSNTGAMNMYHDAKSAKFLTINAEGVSTVITALDDHVPTEKLTGRYIAWVDSLQSDTSNGRPMIIDLPDDDDDDDCLEPEDL